MLKDNYGRKIDYLRISITDRCNLRCRYCMPESGVENKSHEEILTYEEIFKIVKVGAELGIKKIRITGGEPLVRKNVEELILMLSSLNLNDIALSTNGVLLPEKALQLKKAGLDRVNISLDSLDPKKFKKITRRDKLAAVLKGIEASLKAELMPVKLNVVIMKGINDDEIFDFLKLTKNKKLTLRFIEYMPLGGEINLERLILNSEIKKIIQEKHELIPAFSKGNGPADYFKIKGAAGKVGFISAISNEFCSSCSRLRLTADAKFKPCLAGDQEIEIKGMSSQEIESVYKKALKLKPACHHFDFNKKNYNRNMSQIGG